MPRGAPGRSRPRGGRTIHGHPTGTRQHIATLELRVRDDQRVEVTKALAVAMRELQERGLVGADWDLALWRRPDR